ncbi:hypothetical protein MMC31_004554, partial [Peltigera leucophlebia]|nr:hypothetical protein [Peltigera leucophlebia]
MHILLHALRLLPICITGALADFLGPTYPAPVDLTSSKSLLPASWENLTSIFDAYLKENQSIALESLSGVEKVKVSVGLFSTYEPVAAKLQYHYISPAIVNASQCTTKVDGDSIYRMASVSKLFAVFAGLLELTNEDWNRPLTDVIPRLADFPRRTAGEEDPVHKTKWDKITPWTLAAQVAGVPGLGLAAADVLYTYEVAAGSGLGGLGGPDPESIVNNRFQPPSFLPWTTPDYANNGFILLGITISNITSKSMATTYRESIIETLGVTSSNPSPPTGEASLARSVIAGDFALGFLKGGITLASGGLLSTINGLAKLSVEILKSTLIQADLTRKWMKSITHTACLSFSYSVDGPWKVVRYIEPSKVTKLYIKPCNSGSYSGCLVLVPKYNAGLRILDASPNFRLCDSVTNIASDLVTNIIFIILELAPPTSNATVWSIPDGGSSPNSSVSRNFEMQGGPGRVERDIVIPGGWCGSSPKPSVW